MKKMLSTSNLQDANKNNLSEFVSDKTPVPTKKKLTKKNMNVMQRR